MRLINKLLGARSRQLDLAEPLRVAIARNDAIPKPDLRGPLSNQRWLVVDVETTGLDMRRDRLLAIGAVVVEGNSIHFEQSFEVVLKQAVSSRPENILIHRITGSEQTEGDDPPAALAAFLEFSGKLPCVAFHAAFDEAMLKRAYEEYLGFNFSPRFLDLALLAPALIRDASAALQSLDDWIAHFSITISARHRAIADAVGTAQLFQTLLSRASAQRCASAESLFTMERDQGWLTRLNR